MLAECNDDYDKQGQIIAVIKFLNRKGREWEKRVVGDLGTNLACSAGGELECMCICIPSNSPPSSSFFLIILLR